MSAEWPAELDALVAAPESHIVIFENDSVRALRKIVPAGTTEPVHVHRLPSVMIVHQPARIRYFHGTGELLWESPHDADLAVRQPQWMEPEGPHWIENVDSRPYEAYRIELKRAELA